MANLMATAGADALAGAGADADNIIVNQQAYLNAGDSFDGGSGTDILWLTKGMMGIDMPGDLDFQQVTLLNIEELNFNYMGMPMPGQAIFSSAQFGTELLSDSLVVRGSWGSNDVVVNLVTGDTNFDASGWTFPTNDLEGDATGTATSMWGSYIYDNPSNPSSPYAGLDVGTPTEAIQNSWPAGVVYQNGVPSDTVTLNGSTGNNAITGSIVADIIRGDDGNDTLSGGEGSDSIDGGSGADTAVYTGNWGDYTISKSGATYTIAGGPDGGDEVTNVETFQFADGTYTSGQVVSGDQIAPDAPTIADWTDTTTPILMNGANPLWRISGQAEPGTVIKLFTVTLNPDGSVATRTQISTYSQGTPNPTTGAPTVVAGDNFVVSDQDGNWEFQSNLSEHGDRRVQATATDAADNVSDYSLVAIQGSHHSTTFSFTGPSAFAGISSIDGYHQDTGPDTIRFTTASTVTDADFAKIHDIESVALTGASTITLGAMALAAGIGGEITPELGNGGIVTGDGNTSITDANDRNLNVDATALGASATLTLGGAANFKVTGSAVGTSFVGGGGDDTFTGGGGNDTIDGGDGQDAALFSGNFEDYVITEENGTYTVVDNRDGSPDGTDVLMGIEVLTFAQGSVDPGSAGPYYATSGMDLLMGSGFDEDFITNKQAYLGDDDVFNGGGGTDTLWAGQGMGETEPDGLYDENYDFSDVTLLSIEALAFNYMPMPMPGRAVFSSAQFGNGLLSDDLMVYGAWGDNRIVVNLADGDTLFDASGWQFANAGETSGTESAVWGRYTYTGNAMGGMYKNMEVGGLDLIYFNGNADSERVTGTSMRDVFRGGEGADTLIGGAGDDIYFAGAGDLMVERSGGGADTVYSAETLTLRGNIEKLVLTGTGAASGTGNGLANALTGNDANNTLSGLVGDDTILGGDGNDVLIGGAGADRLTGGDGRDKFVYTATSESSRTAPDRIFDLAAGDKIDLSAIDANLGRTGNQAFILDMAGDNSLAAGHIRQIVSGSNLILDFNTDADAAAEMRIVLMNHGTVKVSDFIL